MEHRAAPPAPARSAPRIVLLALLGAALAASVALPSLGSADGGGDRRGGVAVWAPARPGAPTGGTRATGPAPPADPDGVIPDGAAVSVFDEEVPAVGRLDPNLLDALQRAATAAEADGVGILVNSGWRSAEHQQRLLDEAVDEHGSPEEAARWVATPETSRHVSGDAVDVGPPEGAAWLADHGAAHGLCPTYANEPWHFELHPAAVDDGCPPTYADPTEDPRMQP
ncbi:M15 family metallopeptidase [Iamia sp. SCSIO 61187]|nr:M15 family metallopeptidase [Iamia sp. SCSIO 61187]